MLLFKHIIKKMNSLDRELFFFLSLCYRKRGRELEEGLSDFMPLSKRINNLHINNALGRSWNNVNFIPPHSELSEDSTMQGYDREYMPDLNAHQNPHYYENNKLLYNLHMERMQRLS